MFLIPVGHDRDTVWRVPWVSFALLGLLLGASLWAWGDSRDRAGRIFETTLQARQYFLAHPWVQIDAGTEALILDALPEPDRQRVLGLYRAGTRPPDTLGERRRGQEMMEGLAGRARAARQARPEHRFGLVPERPRLASFLTHIAVQPGWLVLLGSLLILYLAGPFLEDAWGRQLFLLLFAGSGIAGAVLHVVVHPGDARPLLGASGAIAGLMGAFLIRFARAEIDFLWVVPRVGTGTFTAPAWQVVPVWVLEQIIVAMVEDRSNSAAAPGWAVLGGFAFGIALALWIRRSRVEERLIWPPLNPSSVDQ